MIFFKLAQVLLSPGVFLFALIIAGVFLLPRRVGKVLLVCGLFLYYILSITPVADFLLASLENKHLQLQTSEIHKADTIVLLLGGQESSILRAGEALKIYHARLQESGKGITIIISGTDAFNSEDNVQALIVQAFLSERGVSLEDILLEDKSRNTKENAQNAKNLVGSDPFFLVTSASHMPRALEAFRKVGTNPIAAPSDFKQQGKYTVLSFFPHPNNLTKVDLVLHEHAGMVFLKLQRN